MGQGSMNTRKPRPVSDRRYSTAKWRHVRAIVLRRDGERCQIVDGCRNRGNVADHIIPVYPGMPDMEFYDLRNLRAACRQHNFGRAIMESRGGEAALQSGREATLHNRPAFLVRRPFSV